jgi:hypothetical protein
MHTGIMEHINKIPVPVSILPPGFGIPVNFIRIQRLSPETIGNKKKGNFYFSSLFLCWIRDPG